MQQKSINRKVLDNKNLKKNILKNLHRATQRRHRVTQRRHRVTQRRPELHRGGTELHREGQSYTEEVELHRELKIRKLWN